MPSIDTCSSNVELTPNTVIVALEGHEEEQYDNNNNNNNSMILEKSPWKFAPDKWPRTAKVEFMARASDIDFGCGG
jgi:hypothetical protein